MMTTVKEFCDLYDISSASFRRYRTAAETLCGHSVTERQGSKNWVIVDENALLAVLPDYIKDRSKAVETVLEPELLDQSDEIPEVSSALTVVNSSNILNLDYQSPVSIEILKTDFSLAENQVSQQVSDFSALLDNLGTAIELKVAQQIEGSVLSGVAKGYANGMGKLSSGKV
jgi:hypothetical protein